MVLFQPATDYEQYAYDYERSGNRHDYPKTHPYRLVHPVVEDEYGRAQRNTYQGEENTPDQFPFGRHEEDDQKDE